MTNQIASEEHNEINNRHQQVYIYQTCGCIYLLAKCNFRFFSGISWNSDPNKCKSSLNCKEVIFGSVPGLLITIKESNHNYQLKHTAKVLSSK